LARRSASGQPRVPDHLPWRASAERWLTGRAVPRIVPQLDGRGDGDASRSPSLDARFLCTSPIRPPYMERRPRNFGHI
jgi:hypothetical protein